MPFGGRKKNIKIFNKPKIKFKKSRLHRCHQLRLHIVYEEYLSEIIIHDSGEVQNSYFSDKTFLPEISSKMLDKSIIHQ